MSLILKSEAVWMLVMIEDPYGVYAHCVSKTPCNLGQGSRKLTEKPSEMGAYL